MCSAPAALRDGDSDGDVLVDDDDTAPLLCKHDLRPDSVPVRKGLVDDGILLAARPVLPFDVLNADGRLFDEKHHETCERLPLEVERACEEFR